MELIGLNLLSRNSSLVILCWHLCLKRCLPPKTMGLSERSTKDFASYIAEFLKCEPIKSQLLMFFCNFVISEVFNYGFSNKRLYVNLRTELY